MNEKKNGKIIAIVALAVVFVLVAVLAFVFAPKIGSAISEAQDNSAKKAAEKAYASYAAEHADDKLSAYFIYDGGEGRVIALRDGAITGMYANRDKALKVLVGKNASYYLMNEAKGKLLQVVWDETKVVMQYDDYRTEIGEVPANGSGITIGDESLLEILTIDGVKMFHAKDVGQTTLTSGSKTYEITVNKAKVNLITVMGQSNAGAHFKDVTSDITNPIGTAYWWGNNQGLSATAPVDYTQGSMSWHAPLLAELYAQSVAAGDPIKNVLIWHEGITSKNGQQIVQWYYPLGQQDTTVAIIQNCTNYYKQNSDKFEIVGNGVYWIQGESDYYRDPNEYTEKFMHMWGRLKDEAGVEYVAFFRVRHGQRNANTAAAGNTHEDLAYHRAVAAQMKMINDNPEFYLASSITENWTGPDATIHTIDISNYITVMAEYSDRTEIEDEYTNKATYADGKFTTNMFSIFGSVRNTWCHYGKYGATIMGADAGYNMYHALHTSNTFSIVQGDTTGKPDKQFTSQPGDQVTLDAAMISKMGTMLQNLTFRAAPGSVGGTLKIEVRSGDQDITDQVIVTKDSDNYGTIDCGVLKKHSDVTITVTYKTINRDEGSVVYTIQ